MNSLCFLLKYIMWLYSTGDHTLHGILTHQKMLFIARGRRPSVIASVSEFIASVSEFIASVSEFTSFYKLRIPMGWLLLENAHAYDVTKCEIKCGGGGGGARESICPKRHSLEKSPESCESLYHVYLLDAAISIYLKFWVK